MGNSDHGTAYTYTASRVARLPSLPPPLPNEKGTTQGLKPDKGRKPRPETGLDCLNCEKVSRQQDLRNYLAEMWSGSEEGSY